MKQEHAALIAAHMTCMKFTAENANRLARGERPAYGEEAFDHVIEKLDTVSPSAEMKIYLNIDKEFLKSEIRKLAEFNRECFRCLQDQLIELAETRGKTFDFPIFPFKDSDELFEEIFNENRSINP